jgi:hypothetical protein
MGERWRQPAGEYTLYCGKENENHEIGIYFFVYKRIISAVKTVVIVVRYHCYQLHTKLYTRLSPYIQEIICILFDVYYVD